MGSGTFGERQEHDFSQGLTMCFSREIFSTWVGALRVRELSKRQK